MLELSYYTVQDHHLDQLCITLHYAITMPQLMYHSHFLLSIIYLLQLYVIYITLQHGISKQQLMNKALGLYTGRYKSTSNSFCQNVLACASTSLAIAHGAPSSPLLDGNILFSLFSLQLHFLMLP